MIPTSTSFGLDVEDGERAFESASAILSRVGVRVERADKHDDIVHGIDAWLTRRSRKSAQVKLQRSKTGRDTGNAFIELYQAQGRRSYVGGVVASTASLLVFYYPRLGLQLMERIELLTRLRDMNPKLVQCGQENTNGSRAYGVIVSRERLQACLMSCEWHNE